MTYFLLEQDNLPQPRAGVYLLTNVINGKHYVGISKNVKARLYSHSKRGSPRRLRNALKKYGLQNFLAQPIFYALDGFIEELPIVEAILIQDYDSIKNGYNVIEFSDGNYGIAFNELIRAAYQRPDVRAKIAANWSSPEYRDRQKAGLIKYFQSTEGKEAHRNCMRKAWDTGTMRENRAAAFARPEVKARRTAAMREAQKRPETVAKRMATLANPEVKARIIASVTETWSDPALRSAQSNRRKIYLADPENRSTMLEQVALVQPIATRAAAKKIVGSIWITNGIENQRVSADVRIPEGWQRGRAKTVKFGPEKGRSTNQRWITDGVNSTTISRDAAIPPGWRPGRVNARRAA